MSLFDDQPNSQQFDQVEKSAISFLGNASAYNVAGDQHIHYASSPESKPLMMLPPRAQSFVGREDDILWLIQHLLQGSTSKIIVLCGPGGIGKTALAAEALTRLTSQEEWMLRFPDGIFYHSFYAYPSLNTAFEEIAYAFSEKHGSDLYLNARRVLSRRQVLLIFDGVEVLPDAHLLYQLNSGCTVLLLTRRQSDASNPTYCRNLVLLPQEEAIQLLQVLSGTRGGNKESVEKLVQHVGGYPLALQLIGSYLLSRQVEAAEYLQWLESEGLIIMHYGERRVESVPVLLRKTYESLPSCEQHIFLTLGLLAPAPFPWQLVQSILAIPEKDIRIALNRLVNFSILRRQEQAYEICHPLIHTFAKEVLTSQSSTVLIPPPTIIETWRDQYLSILIGHFQLSNPYDYITHSLWYPHVLTFLNNEYLTNQQYFMASFLFHDAGHDVYCQGKYAEAEILHLQALSIREKTLGDENSYTAESMDALGSVYEHQGRHTEAEVLYQRVLAIKEKVLGHEHPNTALTLNNLGLLYGSQGKIDEAEALLTKALFIKEKMSQPDNLSLATGLANLGSLYASKGEYFKAEPLLKRAMDIGEQAGGDKHPDTINSILHLGSIYLSQYRFTEAEPLLKKSVDMSEQVLVVCHS